MRPAPTIKAADRSDEIPGAATGRSPNAASDAWSWRKPMTGIAREPASSEVMTSGTARPIQFRESSPVRFSNRRMATRDTLTDLLGEEQEKVRIPNTARMQTARGLLENTRFHGEQFLELRQLPERSEFRVFHHLLTISITFFESL